MIAILLCTYNGERFLKEQIDSLLKQTNQNFEIYIHDDGSSDATLAIVADYTERHRGKIHYLNDEVKHRGAGASFMWLLNKIDADYYMFCDQDDVWLPDKVEHTYKRIKEVECEHSGVPILIHTDLQVCDENLQMLYPSFWKYQNFKVDISKKKEYIGFGNIVTGCTMIINREVKDVAFPYNNELMHDYWLALCVAKNGYIDNLKEATILYRQHGSNTAGIGGEYRKSRINIKAFLKNVGVERKRVSDVAHLSFMEWCLYRIIYFVNRRVK